MKRAAWLAGPGLLLLSSAASATDFYVDPKVPNGNGTSEKPWSSLQQLFDQNLIETQNWETLPYAEGKPLVPQNPGAPIKAGDTIWLRSGDYGELTIQSHYNAAPIRIVAVAGEIPKFSKVTVQGAQNWTLEGLDVASEYALPVTKDQLVKVLSPAYQGPSRDIAIVGFTVKTREDVAAWVEADWDTMAANGIRLSGERCIARDNRVKNVNFGITTDGIGGLLEGNVVDNFSGDGMRVLGDDSVVQYNIIKNARQVNDNHSDGIQSWSPGPGEGVIKNVVIRGNYLLNFEDPALPFHSKMQGIGLFDGTYENFVIENNVVIAGAYHGIAIYGSKSSRIVNNTVVDVDATDEPVPWITVEPHKNGTPSEGTIVRNNLSSVLKEDQVGVTFDHNMVTTDLAALFVAPATFDFHLLPTSPARDVGSAESAPAADLDQWPRPEGAAVDLGAYEWHVPPPPDAGASSGGEPGPVPDSGAGTSGSGGGSGGLGVAPVEDQGGCGCSEAPGQQTGSALLVGIVALLLRRRSRDA